VIPTKYVSDFYYYNGENIQMAAVKRQQNDDVIIIIKHYIAYSLSTHIYHL